MKHVHGIRPDDAAVSPVIATILMVAITVVLAAVLYVMVSGFLTVTPPSRTLGVDIQPTSDRVNWEVRFVNVPQSLTTAETRVTIIRLNGTTNLSSTAFSSLATCPTFASGLCYQGDGNLVNVGDRLLLRMSWYPAGKVEIKDANSILFTGDLG